jgi:Leucine-rich repeat (LRR) protein
MLRTTSLIGPALFLTGLPLAQAATDCTVVTDIPQSECEVLVDLYNSTDGPNWTDNMGWNVTNTPCNWGGVSYEADEKTYIKGVVCENGHVRKIDLYQNNLNGPIPESITQLTRLTSLKLGSNNLGGDGSRAIPDFLGDLTNLWVLSLSGNQFIGQIPDSLGNLTKLRSLFLSKNPIGGTIPAFLGGLTHLKTLSMHNNELSGSLQPLENLANLQKLWLYNNDLSGTIEVLGNFPQLVETSVSYNDFSGTIPEELGDLNNLEYFSAHHNELSGSIPSVLGNLTRLQKLVLTHNQLSGSIPESLGNLNNLTVLSLQYNELSGSIPNTLGNLTSLQALWLYKNQLSGTIPAELGNLSQLLEISLSNNNLSGSIPEFLGNLDNLERLSLHKNQLSGSIPESLGNLNKLQKLKLHANELCGDIPVSLMNMSNLSQLIIDNNHLTASDPDLSNWLNSNNPGWATTQTPCFASSNDTCLVYGLHDEGLNDTQFFTINPNQDNEVYALGSTHVGHDIEGMDLHPMTQELYASSGDDQAKGLENGYIYRVNKNDGSLTPICSTGLGEISAMSFRPTDATLWVWADGEGLFTIDINKINNGICEKTEIVPHSANVEGLAWSVDGKILYGSEGKTLYRYSPETGAVDQACNDFPSQVEALEMLADGTLLFGLHQASDTSIHSFDIGSCSVKDSVPLPVDTPYTDIEGIAWKCP